MSTTLKRTSMALDAESIESLEILSKRWEVSKAEVLRRSLAKLREDEDSQTQLQLEALDWFRTNGMTRKQANDFRAEIHTERLARKDPWAETFEKIALEKEKS